MPHPPRPTVMQRLGLTRRGPLRMIPTNEGERRLTAAEVRAMRLARMDYIGQQADAGRNETLDARRHVSLMRRHGRVRIDGTLFETKDGREVHFLPGKATGGTEVSL